MEGTGLAPATVRAMKVDGGIGTDLNTAAQSAKELEAAGYSGLWTAETSHDPFFPLLLAAEQHHRRRARHVASPWPSPATR